MRVALASKTHACGVTGSNLMTIRPCRTREITRGPLDAAKLVLSQAIPGASQSVIGVAVILAIQAVDPILGGVRHSFLANREPAVSRDTEKDASASESGSTSIRSATMPSLKVGDKQADV